VVNIYKATEQDLFTCPLPTRRSFIIIIITIIIIIIIQTRHNSSAAIAATVVELWPSSSSFLRAGPHVLRPRDRPHARTHFNSPSLALGREPPSASRLFVLVRKGKFLIPAR
jgi:hypothetical protein